MEVELKCDGIFTVPKNKALRVLAEEITVGKRIKEQGFCLYHGGGDEDICNMMKAYIDKQSELMGHGSNYNEGGPWNSHRCFRANIRQF